MYTKNNERKKKFSRRGKFARAPTPLAGGSSTEREEGGDRLVSGLERRETQSAAAQSEQHRSRMEGKKVLNISIENVVCATKDGDMALPGLQSGEAFVRGEPVERKSAAKAATFGLVGAPPPLTLPMKVLLPATQA